MKEASALGRAGYPVTVLAVASQERYEAFDRELLRSAPFRKVVVDLRPGRGLASAASLPSRGATWLLRRAVRWGLGTAQALGPAAALARRARSLPADLTIVHTELGLGLGAGRLGRGARVAADFEDWHSRDLLPEARRGRPLRLIEGWEQALIRGAAYVSTTSDAMASALQSAHGGARPVVIRNCFPLQPDPAAWPRPGPPAFFWFSQTIGPGRMLEQFLAAWRLTRQPSRFCLLGEVAPAYREKLVDRLPPDRRRWLEFLPVVAPGELPAIIARHDIGLALEPGQPDNKNFTISNKILQYLNAGLAVLATETAGQSEVLARAPDAGLFVRPAETGELAATLDALAAAPARVAAMGAAARRAAEAVFCWEREEPRLLAAVAAALGGPPVA